MLKKVFAFVVALSLILQPAFSAFTSLITENKSVKASEFMVTINGGKTVSIQDLATMSTDRLQELTGHKMNFLEKIAFKASQKKLQKQINEDGTLNMKSLEKLSEAGKAATSGFNLAGFLLGLFLTLIGVLIAYIITDFKMTPMTKWAWIGAAIGLLLWGVVFI